MNIIETLSLPEWICCRCSHRWYPRKLSYPKRCPSCTSAYWDTPKREEREPEVNA